MVEKILSATSEREDQIYIYYIDVTNNLERRREDSLSVTITVCHNYTDNYYYTVSHLLHCLSLNTVIITIPAHYYIAYHYYTKVK